MLSQIKISRLLTQWLISSVGLFLLVIILPGVSVNSWSSILITSAVIGLLNALLWPLLIKFALPVTVITLGFASIILNGFVILFASQILQSFSVESFWSAIAVSFGLSILTTVIRQVLVINDDDTYYRNVIKREAKKYQSKIVDKAPGVLFLQLDGVAYDVLKRAISDGNAPTLAKWLRSGEYKMEKWECNWSSQTGASQAGILMGAGKDIPAFRWLEKDTGKMMAFANPRDVSTIEKRLSTKKGLLAHDGASRGNLLSGDAEYTLLTLSTVTNPDRKNFGRDYFAYFANPYNFTRTLVFTITDIIHELRESIDQKRRDVRPRLDKKERFYPLIRAWTTVIQQDIVFQTLISDMYKGRSVIYADFVGYDEVSHHSGVERHQTIAILRDLDAQIARLSRVAKDAPRPYHMIILSDHGQTQGATFTQRTGFTLEELIERLSKEPVSAPVVKEESVMYLNAAVKEASAPDNISGKTLETVTKHHTTNGHATNGHVKTNKDITVMASGCLGLIYFNKSKNRTTLEEIEEDYPGLINGLRNQQFIGFLLVNSKKHGGVVMGKNGIYYLSKDTVDGHTNPLTSFGPNAAEKVKKIHDSKYVADIMINSFYDPETDEVASFEDQVGSHGGMGGKQSYPFVFFPKHLHFPKTHLLGAENLHKVLKQWLVDLGQRPAI